MKALKTLMVLAVALMAAFCIVPSEVDAEVFVNSPNDTIHFNTMNGGSISLDVQNDGSAVDATVRIVESDGDEIYNKNHLIPTGESTLKLNLYDYKSEGTHSLTIYFEPADKFAMDSMNLEIVVDKHILSNWTTYVVIIFVVIVIAILVYMKIRDSPSKSKPFPTRCPCGGSVNVRRRCGNDRTRRSSLPRGSRAHRQAPYR